MRFSFISALTLALAAESALASTWLGKAVYNKWHETELERWLSDHNVPYPTPADRKDLENLVKDNWQSKVVAPYNEWDVNQLQSYVKAQNKDAKAKVASNKKALVKQIESTWTDTAESAASSYANIRDWIFDSWTDSQLKAFADKHGIPVPQPRKRDSLLKAVRENYEKAAKKANEYTQYPGDWLYESWSESDIKAYLDERGIPVPQPSKRDKLVATLRRNSRVASLQVKEAAAAAAASAAAVRESLSDAVINSWTESQLKAFCDKNGIKVPQGSKLNQLQAIVRKHRAELLGEDVAGQAASAYGAATSKAGNEYAKASTDAELAAKAAFDEAIEAWSDSRLKAYLDSRGVPVPQGGKRDELLASVRLQSHKASTGWTAWTFDTWTTENLQKWLEAQNNKAAKKAGATREELLKQAQDSYESASKAGGDVFASATSYLASATDAAKDDAFDSWSESEVKKYLDSYGIKTYQGSTLNELRALARRNANYFRYGTTTPQDTIIAKIQNGVQWVLDQVKAGAASGRQEAEEQGEKAKEAINKAKEEL